MCSIRAFDLVPDVDSAIEGLIKLGCTRILTGGQQAHIEKGIPLLKELQSRYGSQIELLCGGGVTKGKCATLNAGDGNFANPWNV